MVVVCCSIRETDGVVFRCFSCGGYSGFVK